MLSTKYYSFLGYIRLKTPEYNPFYTFPIPVITEELNSQSPPFVIGLDCNHPDMLEILISNLTEGEGSTMGIVDLPLTSTIICPFLSILHGDILITAPIYPYCDFIRPYILNSKLVQINKLQIEVYSDNIEILSAEILAGFSPDLLLNVSGYSKFPSYSLTELLNYVTPESFPNISQYLIETLTSELE